VAGGEGALWGAETHLELGCLWLLFELLWFISIGFHISCAHCLPLRTAYRIIYGLILFGFEYWFWLETVLRAVHVRKSVAGIYVH